MKLKINQYTNFVVTEVFASQGESFDLTGPECESATLGYYYSGSCQWTSSNLNFNMVRGDFAPFVNSIEEGLGSINVPEHNKVNVAMLSDAHWVCMQRVDESPEYCKNGSLITIDTEQVVPVGNGVFMLEGTATANDSGSALFVEKFDYINPRTYEYAISGNGKAFLVQTI